MRPVATTYSATKRNIKYPKKTTTGLDQRASNTNSGPSKKRQRKNNIQLEKQHSTGKPSLPFFQHQHLPCRQKIITNS